MLNFRCSPSVEVQIAFWLSLFSLSGFSSKLHFDLSHRLEICQKIYTTEDFRVKNLHKKRVIFDIFKSRQKVRKRFELG